MYPPHHLGGYELMWQSSVEHLRQLGHEVRVLTTTYRGSDQATAPGNAGVHRELPWYWHEHRFPRLSPRARLALEREAHRVLRRHLGDFQPSVVAWWAMGGMSMSLLERVRREGPRAVGVVVDDWLVYGPKVDAWQRAFGKPGLERVAELLTGIPTRFDLASCANWVCVSARVRDRAIQEGREIQGAKIAHAGIDDALFRPVDSQQWEGRLLCLGRIDPRKGADTAIKALAELPDARLAIIGGGDERHLSELKKLTRGLGVEDRVAFERRSRQEIPAAIAAADVVLFPVQWQEPWGLVPIEAMAVGRPVIASGTGGSAEYLRDAENCLVYAPKDDPSALAARVRQLEREPELRDRIRDGGFATAARFTEARFNDAVLEALKGDQ